MTTAPAPALVGQMTMRQAQPSEGRALQAWIGERHYTGCTPPGYGLALEFVAEGERVGGMLLGRPTSRELDPDVWLELTRMFFVDAMPLNTESRGLALMRRHVRVWLPRVRALIAYADPGQGHEGKVYEADGWAAFGRTQGGGAGFTNRPGRRPVERTSKVRWVRTP